MVFRENLGEWCHRSHRWSSMHIVLSYNLDGDGKCWSTQFSILFHIVFIVLKIVILCGVKLTVNKQNANLCLIIYWMFMLVTLYGLSTVLHAVEKNRSCICSDLFVEHSFYKWSSYSTRMDLQQLELDYSLKNIPIPREEKCLKCLSENNFIIGPTDALEGPFLWQKTRQQWKKSR